MLRCCLIFSGSGVSKISITGGKPFLRKDLPALLSEISTLENIQDLSLTTNGLLTANYLQVIKKAKIRSVNLSLDTLDDARFFQITRRKGLDKVLNTMHLLIDHQIKVKLMQ